MTGSAPAGRHAHAGPVGGFLLRTVGRPFYILLAQSSSAARLHPPPNARPSPAERPACSEGRAYGIGVARTDTIFVKSRLNALGAKPSGNHSVDRLLLHLGGCQHVRLQPERCCAALECHVARVDAIHG